MLATVETRKLTFAEVVKQELTDQQVKDLWYDWFCKEEALVRRGRLLIKKMRTIADSQRIPANAGVFFKNNCPMSGRLYDSFSIVTGDENRDVLFWVAPKLGYDVSSGEAQVSLFRPTEETVTGTWADVKRFFKSTDAEWATYKATLPPPKFTVGTKVAVLGGYDGVKEDEVAQVGDEGRFTLKSDNHFTFKANGTQVVPQHRRRHGWSQRVRHCELWQEHHDAELAKAADEKRRTELVLRVRAIKNKLYNFEYGTNEEIFARESKIAAIEAILEVK